MRWRWRPKRGWIRFFARCAAYGVLGFVVFVVAAWTVLRQPRVMTFFFTTMIQHGLDTPLEEPKTVAPATPPQGLARPASPEEAIREGALFGVTNVWDVRLHFTSNEWAALAPRRVPPLREVFQRDGRIALLNPAASRPGVAGSMGIDLPWSTGTVVVAGTELKQVAVRFKGNGTFLDSSRTYRRSYKLDLNEHVAGRSVAGRKTLNLGNLGTDATAGLEAVGYALHEAAGVPAPHTAFARVTLSIEGRFENRLLGLYVLVEDIDAAWVTARFGKRGAAVFKPVTYDVFGDLGTEWAAYEPVYNAKTRLTDADRLRVITTAQFFTGASDAEFARRIGEFLDLDEIARFFACQVLISNYDGLLGTGQNMLLYLDARSGRFGMAPWDLDQAWGRIGFAGTASQRVHASVRHPWMGRNSFLERLFRTEAFVTRYEAALRTLLDRWFTPEFLETRFDEISHVVRPFLAEEDPEKAKRHDASLEAAGPENGPGRRPDDANHRVKQFIRDRAASVRAQLEDREVGEIIRMQTFW